MHTNSIPGRLHYSRSGDARISTNLWRSGYCEPYYFQLSMLCLLHYCSPVAEVKKNAAIREIVSQAPKLIGNADKFQVDVKGNKGDFTKLVTITGSKVQLSDQLTADELLLTLNNVKTEKKPLGIIEVGSSLFTLRLSDKQLNSYLEKSKRNNIRGMRNITVKFYKNYMQVSAITNVLDRDVQLITDGLLQPLAATQLIFLPQNVNVGGLDIPATIQQELADRINPLIDMSAFTFKPRVTSISLEPGVAIISGNADIISLFNDR